MLIRHARALHFGRVPAAGARAAGERWPRMLPADRGARPCTQTASMPRSSRRSPAYSGTAMERPVGKTLRRLGLPKREVDDITSLTHPLARH